MNLNKKQFKTKFKYTLATWMTFKEYKQIKKY